jgi:hypothetical protein
MALSDDPHRKTLPSRRKRPARAIDKTRWSDSQKIECVTTYIKLGNITRVAELLKIPRPTIITWRATEWWVNIEKELRAEENIVLSSSMKTLVDKSLLVVEDRLDKGDWIYDTKLAKLVRKPVSMKDALKVSTDLIDKRIEIATHENYTVAQENIEQKLQKLAQSFEDAVKNKTPVQVTDVIFVEEKKE